FTFPPELTGRIYFDPDRYRLVLRSYLGRSELDRLIEGSKERIDALLKDPDMKTEVRPKVQEFLSKLEPALERLYRISEADQAAATPVYELAARAAASITQTGLRGVLTGIVLDSLVSSGRFEDARAYTAVLPDESQRFVALGTIAEAQGRRGAAESARR